MSENVANEQRENLKNVSNRQPTLQRLENRTNSNAKRPHRSSFDEAIEDQQENTYSTGKAKANKRGRRR